MLPPIERIVGIRVALVQAGGPHKRTGQRRLLQLEVTALPVQLRSTQGGGLKTGAREGDEHAFLKVQGGMDRRAVPILCCKLHAF